MDNYSEHSAPELVRMPEIRFKDYRQRAKFTAKMKKLLTFFAIALSAVMMTACRSGSSVVASAQVPGHYTYQHGWNYDVKEGHINVHETGTMDFYRDGTALDSARQVYEVTLKSGGIVTWVFNYVSPSKWRLEGEDFYFSGVEESFRMELKEVNTVRCDSELDLARRIMAIVRGSIARETKFHLNKLTTDELQWSYTYSDGHTDTWEFYRIR